MYRTLLITKIYEYYELRMVAELSTSNFQPPTKYEPYILCMPPFISLTSTFNIRLFICSIPPFLRLTTTKPASASFVFAFLPVPRIAAGTAPQMKPYIQCFGYLCNNIPITYCMWLRLWGVLRIAGLGTPGTKTRPTCYKIRK
jgi:hypothetical protein